MILGLVGPKGVGKDTVADYLVKKYDFTKVAFADPIKDVCHILYGVPRQHFEDPVLKESPSDYCNKSPRVLMQEFGTDVCRKYMGDKFWIEHMERRLRSLNNTNVVITDVRFVNEAMFLHTLGGTLVRIDRSTSDRGVDNHITETQQYIIDTTESIYNTSLPELYRQVDELLVRST